MGAPTPQVRQLFLLRHAKSSWDDPGLADVDRPLAPRGRKAVKKVARYLRREGIDPQVVLCSPALRTRQTLERLGSVVREDVSVRIERKLYGAGRTSSWPGSVASP